MNSVEIINTIDESFSLKSSGNWASTRSLADKIAGLRKNVQGPAQCGTSVASWGDKGGACTHAGWGD